MCALTSNNRTEEANECDSTDQSPDCEQHRSQTVYSTASYSLKDKFLIMCALWVDN